MLDASGGYGDLLDRAAGIYEQWRAAAAELEELERSEQEKLRLLDLWQFQRKEIESANLEAEEDAALENERRVLQNVQRLEEAAGAAYGAVYEGEESALRLTRAALKRVDELCRIDGSLEPLREHLKSADLSLQEASYGLRDYLSRLEANPGRLEEVESRLEAIARLKRKYGQSIAEVLRFLEDVRRQIASVENASERMEELRRERTRLAAEFESSAAALTARRRAAARKLEQRVEAELAQLAMERTVFRVEIAAAAWSADGADRVEFLVSPNVGEEPQAAGESRLGRRDFAHRTGIEDLPGGTEERDDPHAGLRRSGCRRGRKRSRGNRTPVEEAGGSEPGLVRDAPAAGGVVRRSSLPGGEARIEGAHGSSDGRTGRRRADPRDRANALGAEAHRRSAQARRTTD